jgi:5,5'-dehydrodivanillate O-demethylase oxygenase subunit
MNASEEQLRRRGERLRALTQTAADTLMGKLLRRFWHPVAVSKQLRPGAAKPVRIMSEDLTLYRSEDGNAHLVGAYCAHRRSLLHTGWVEGEQIRCMYHGWMFDGTGQCTLRPAERDKGLPNIKIPAYPVHEYAGMIFAYLGPDTTPPFELPRKPCFEGNGFHVVRRQIWPCNWLQLVENSLDALHVSFVHARGRAGRFIENVSQALPELEYVETDAGIRQIATRGPDNVRVSDWTFPNNNHIKVPGPLAGGPWVDAAIWNVPIDDTKTLRMNVYAMPSLGKETDDKLVAQWEAHENYDPSQHHDELFYDNAYPEDYHSDLTNAQDYVAQVGQGTIADRENEILGRSDAGIAFLRNLYFRELDLIRENLPTKRWRLLPEAVELPTQHAGSTAGSR